MKALISNLKDNQILTQLSDIKIPEIGPEEVLIRARFSSLNFKDALGVSGQGRIFKGTPRIGGIDVSGEIAQTRSTKFQEGDKVVVTGCGLGEVFDGGYAEYVRFPAESVIPLPPNLNLEEAMIYGTAGFTAALVLQRFFQNDQVPEKGPIAVTGASGGVGSFAIYFLSKSGFEVIGISEKSDRYEFLHQLGASQVLPLSKLELGTRPLETVKFGGAVDNSGGQTLAALSRHIGLWGNIACVGMAESHEFKMSVMPLILRGVSLLGISSNNCTPHIRETLWQWLANELKPKNLSTFVSQTGNLTQVVELANKMLNRQTWGRVIIRCET